MSESAVIERPTVECNGETFLYRPESWDIMPFAQIQESNLYGVIWEEALMENSQRPHHSQLFESGDTPRSSHYRNSAWDHTSLVSQLARTNQSFATRIAQSIYDEAVIANDEWDAYIENERRTAPASVVEPTPERLTYEADQQAALAQAEILGATADQRTKLRNIVQAEHDARRRVQELETLLSQNNAELAAARAPITNPSDRRVWPIFGAAAQEANKQGYCSVYDQISEAVDIPNRDDLSNAGYLNKKRWDVRVAVQVSYTDYVTVAVEADTYDEAISEADNISHRHIFDCMNDDTHDLEPDDIDSIDAQEAEVVDD